MTRLNTVALILFAVLLVALPANAQMYQTQMAYTTCSVPFQFVVTDIDGMQHALPAGDYSLNALSPSVLLLKGDGVSVMLGTTERFPSSEIADSKLVFVKDGDQYVLHQIWTANQKHVHDLVHAGGAADVY